MSLLRCFCKLRSVFYRSRYVLNIGLKKNMSALVQQYDELDYYSYENTNNSITDTYSLCWYCKGTRYVKCTFCEKGCSHCNNSRQVPCPFCNKKLKTDFVLLTGLN